MKQLSDSVLKHLRNKKATVLDSETYTKFAIFVPLIELNHELHFIFQVRSRLVRQPGEVCFPGGKVDKTDPTVKYAAIRELSEELGVPPADAEILGELDYLVTPFRLMLFPFIGILPPDTAFNINKDEVEDIFYVPVSQLLNMEPKEHYIKLEAVPEDNFPYHLIPNGENYNWRTGVINEQFYEHQNYVIWGLTARILTHALKELHPTDNQTK
ncbi:NUDIX hydrolase [Salipaludibacillus aurantiacus]|uniref:8-oxo-dGTP pyrophosphatase MutT, NUDIX family n=1 Tax=Salipaludibacillus aurantiacus TaxID=1601833 RepID=A0A1H9RHY5_9BACI|nr:CoA pyrophosphatase [Salipaludibacillus aurantiacus]SER72248.1 8-oxo-dGTP pyrophosphatase MutT, NUDIX family [Salipaludibacillus aurantiacus]